jgi:hypothetical protein
MLTNVNEIRAQGVAICSVGDETQTIVNEISSHGIAIQSAGSEI